MKGDEIIEKSAKGKLHKTHAKWHIQKREL